MIVSTAQPYFAPYPGFFAKILLCNTLILLDTVQFPQRTGWMTRNRFKNEQGTGWMTIPVRRKGQGLQRIADVKIDGGRNWPRKHLKSLKASYGRAPFFEEHLPFLESLFATPPDRLLDLNVSIIRHVLAALEIATPIRFLSELGIEEKEPRLTMEICRALGAKHFLAQRPAGKFHDAEALRREGIQLRLFAPHPPVYPQLYGKFIANLSVFDLIFTCGPKAASLISDSIAWDDKKEPSP